MKSKSVWKPCCPTCNEPLDVSFPLKPKGRGRCPVGMIMVDYEIDLNANEVVVDKNGLKTKAKVYQCVGEKHN